MEKSHWRLQPLYWPNQPFGKAWVAHYIQVENRTLACERAWSELASWTLHSAIAKKRNRRSTTSSRTVPSGGNRGTSYGRRMSQPPTSCGERRKTCAAPPNSWQHVDWGSKHGWSTAEEEEEEKQKQKQTQKQRNKQTNKHRASPLIHDYTNQLVLDPSQ